MQHKRRKKKTARLKRNPIFFFAHCEGNRNEKKNVYVKNKKTGTRKRREDKKLQISSQ